MTASAEMPKYKCHKEVHALKIKEVRLHRQEGSIFVGATIVPEEDGYAEFEVDAAYLTKHEPEVGGYYVVYADGYKSYSPAGAFEEGYTRI